METQDFDYNLPKKFIAQYPPKVRGRSRLMVLDRSKKTIKHKKYLNIPEYIEDGDVIVLNETKVINARIFVEVERTGREVEVLLLNKLPDYEYDDSPEDFWYCLIGRARYVKLGDELRIGDYVIHIRDREEGSPGFIVSSKDMDKIVQEYGHVPLPPYIDRDDTEQDKDRYNTVFARKRGAVAAPTASLNLTDEILREIEEKGGKVVYLNLVVGWGTFAPVLTDQIEDFEIHKEYIDISQETAEIINGCQGSVWAFGTTVVRALESAAVDEGKIKPTSRFTDLFIYPGYDFKIVDNLVTNFHVPKSSLIMLVSAFAGKEFVFQAYEEAKQENYRFLSYGDSMLIQ